MSSEARLIPKTMSSQHPDNSHIPSWAKSEVVAGEDEVYEAFYCYHLGCQEVMWDAEGKDIDPNVVRKLLSSYPDYFRRHVLGRDLFLTYRVPNPSVEVADRKVFLETMEAIPAHHDIAERFYEDGGLSPVFEVILPFTTSHHELIRVKETYRRIIVDSMDSPIDFTGFKLKSWIGEPKPHAVEVIPLIEDKDTLLRVDEILSRFVEIYSPRYMRVFIARSDPALNYGFVAATLLAKLALSRIWKLGETLNIPFHPIIGAGCLPFRGHNSPSNVEGFIEEYKGVHTATVQSAFRYDYPEEEVRSAIERLNNTLPKTGPRIFDQAEEESLKNMIEIFSRGYLEVVEKAVDMVNSLVDLVPARRGRKLHIGLFGYARRLGGKSLPRAIPFTAIFYSLGMPPEFIGLHVLQSVNNLDLLAETHKRIRQDLAECGGKVSWDNINTLMEGSNEVKKALGPEFVEEFLPLYLRGLEVVEEFLGTKLGPQSLTDRRHENTVNNFLISLMEGDRISASKELLSAAMIRRSLG